MIPEYFKGYVSLISEDMPVLEALNHYGPGYLSPLWSDYMSLGNQVYEDGKWTIREILVHLIDAERIFAYRALRIARGDRTPLTGFDHDAYVSNSRANNRSFESVLQELSAVRNATIALFESFDNDQLNLFGTASGKEVSVLALGFMICGHLVHHTDIINSRYLPLLRPD